MPYQFPVPEALLQTPKVELWYRALLTTTGVSADEHLLRLHRFSRHSNVHPEELLQLPESHQQMLIEGFRKAEEALKHDATRSVEAVRHWIRFGKE
ncbi:MAG: hypothetical protein L3K02_02155 [Thermoplasmata archaeon]|nr:hypothetical protein [Thermoplasmata archaeon]